MPGNRHIIRRLLKLKLRRCVRKVGIHVAVVDDSKTRTANGREIDETEESKKQAREVYNGCSERCEKIFRVQVQDDQEMIDSKEAEVPSTNVTFIHNFQNKRLIVTGFTVSDCFDMPLSLIY